MDSVLRPRDIQARIRSGETPEAVASVAQTTVEKVMVFASPVLAERAWVAEQAQKASVRRRAGNGPIGHLGEAVAERLAGEDVDPEAVEWDAWRREDGRWTLVADFPGSDGPRRATFAYDTAGRYVVAEDEEARRLVGERAGPPPSEPSAPSAPAPRDDPAQTALGDDAIELVTGRRPETVREPAELPRDGTADLAGEATVDLTEAARAARTARTPRPLVPAPPEWMTTQASDRPAPPQPPAEQAAATGAPVDEPGTEEALFGADEVEPEATGGSSADPAQAAGTADGATEEAPESAPDEAAARRKPRKAASKARKGRASVPSWDEIMFGSGKGE